MLQLSTVCTKFGQAATLVPSLQQGVSALDRWPKAKPDRLDSPLLLQWAVHMGSFHLRDETYSLPGLMRLVAAAENATSLHLKCDDVQSAAQADLLMCSCRSVTRLALRGACLPSILPLTVTHLVADFETDDNNAEEWDVRQANALIYHAARLPLLKQLFLHFLLEEEVVQLSCPIQLQCLDKLVIRMPMVDNDLCLAWAVQQPCTSLEFHLALDTPGQARHAAMVALLSQVQLSSLMLRLALPETLLGVWGQLKTRRLHILVDSYDGFSRPGTALQTLPHCELLLDTTLAFNNDPRPRTFWVAWGALTSPAALILVILGPSHRLCVAGAGKKHSAPEQLQQPWQLVVCGGRRVKGLPASQPTQHTYCLQNAAAQPAGGDDVESVP